MAENRLSSEDQARIDEFLASGVNSVERRPFRPLILLLVSLAALTGFSLLSVLIARLSGVY